MNGRNDEREIEDDGFYSVNFDERAYDKESLLLPSVPPTDRTGLDAEADEVLLREDGEECRDEEVTCERCLGTGYRRDWRGTRVQCDDCWSDNGPES